MTNLSKLFMFLSLLTAFSCQSPNNLAETTQLTTPEVSGSEITGAMASLSKLKITNANASQNWESDTLLYTQTQSNQEYLLNYSTSQGEPVYAFQWEYSNNHWQKKDWLFDPNQRGSLSHVVTPSNQSSILLFGFFNANGKSLVNATLSPISRLRNTLFYSGQWETRTLDDIMTSSPNESTEQRMTSHRGNVWDPAPSPWGHAIVAGKQPSAGSPNDLYILDTQGQELTRLTQTDWEERHPSWSPNGQYILYSVSHNNRNSIRMIKIDGTQDKELYGQNNFLTDFPSWHPDGTQFLYVSATHIHKVTLDKDMNIKENTRLTDSIGIKEKPSFSPDGQQILYSQDNQIILMDAMGKNARQITEGTMPAWSPDGKRIAFIRRQTGLFTSDLNGGSLTQISKRQFLRSVSWSQ